jgi:hypothetical protein
MSGTVTTAHVVDPNTPVVFNGLVMRAADFAMLVSSNSEAAQRLRSPEMQSHEKVQPTPPSKQKD